MIWYQVLGNGIKIKFNYIKKNCIFVYGSVGKRKKEATARKRIDII